MADESELAVEGCVTIEGQRVCGDNLSVTEVSEPTESAPPTETAPEPEAGPGLFDWADPILADPLGWAQANLLSADILLPYLWQAGAIIAALLIGAMLTSRVRELVFAGLARLPKNIKNLVEETAPKLVRPAPWAALLYLAQAAMAGAGMDSTFVRIASSLSLAWLLISIVTAFLPEGFRKPAGWVIWVFAAFYAFGILDEVMTWLNSIGPPFGGRTISPVFVVQAIAKDEQRKLQQSLGLGKSPVDRDMLITAYNQQKSKSAEDLKQLLQVGDANQKISAARLITWIQQWQKINRDN